MNKLFLFFGALLGLTTPADATKTGNRFVAKMADASSLFGVAF